MEKYIIAMRKDGLGVRLMALLNSIALAHHAKCKFRFIWVERKDLFFHDIESADIMFEKTYLSNFLIQECEVKDLRQLQLDELIDSSERGVFFCCSQSINPIKQYSLDAFNYLKNCDYRYFFSNIGFSKKNIEAVEAAYKVALPEGQVALHLRAGDVVYGKYRVSGSYTDKVISVPVAVDIAKNNKNILVFSQDVAVGLYLKNNYSAVLSTDLCQNNFDGVQRALFDIVLMSRCNKIIADKSGFAMCAAQLANIELTRPHGLYSEEEVMSLISDSINNCELNGKVPNLQIAHAIQKYLTLDISTSNNNRLGFIKIASEYDPENMFYTFLEICYHLSRSDYEIAESLYDDLDHIKIDKLVDVIERNFDHIFLKPYTDSQRFESILFESANHGSQVANLICSLIYYFRKDLVLAKKYSDRTVSDKFSRGRILDRILTNINNYSL